MRGGASAQLGEASLLPAATPRRCLQEKRALLESVGPYSLATGAGGARTPGLSPGGYFSPYARTPGGAAAGYPGTPGGALTPSYRGTPLGGARTPGGGAAAGGLALRGRAAKYAEVVRKINAADASKQTFDAVAEFAAACADEPAGGWASGTAWGQLRGVRRRPAALGGGALRARQHTPTCCACPSGPPAAAAPRRSAAPAPPPAGEKRTSMARVWAVLGRALAGVAGLPASAKAQRTEALLAGGVRYLEENFVAYMQSVVQAHRMQVRAGGRAGPRAGRRAGGRVSRAGEGRGAAVLAPMWEAPSLLGRTSAALLRRCPARLWPAAQISIACPHARHHAPPRPAAVLRRPRWAAAPRAWAWCRRSCACARRSAARSTLTSRAGWTPPGSASTAACALGSTPRRCRRVAL